MQVYLLLQKLKQLIEGAPLLYGWMIEYPHNSLVNAAYHMPSDRSFCARSALCKLLARLLLHLFRISIVSCDCYQKSTRVYSLLVALSASFTAGKAVGSLTI